MNKEKFKRWFFPILLAGLVILAALNLVSKTQGLQVLVQFPNGQSLIAEVADSPEEHLMAFYAAGTLGSGRGVLIMYEESGRNAVWTKSLRAPVDVVWMGPTREIVKIQENVTPCSGEPCPAFESDSAVLFLLQTDSGAVRELGLKEGMAVGFSRIQEGTASGERPET